MQGTICDEASLRESARAEAEFGLSLIAMQENCNKKMGAYAALRSRTNQQRCLSGSLQLEPPVLLILVSAHFTHSSATCVSTLTGTFFTYSSPAAHIAASTNLAMSVAC